MASTLQHIQPPTQDATRLDQQPEAVEHFGLWLTSHEARAFIGCPNLSATRQWLWRHGIVRRSNGTVSRKDLERELNRPRRHRMHARSLANLRKRVG